MSDKKKLQDELLQGVHKSLRFLDEKMNEDRAEHKQELRSLEKRLSEVEERLSVAENRVDSAIENNSNMQNFLKKVKAKLYDLVEKEEFEKELKVRDSAVYSALEDLKDAFHGCSEITNSVSQELQSSKKDIDAIKEGLYLTKKSSVQDREAFDKFHEEYREHQGESNSILKQVKTEFQVALETVMAGREEQTAVINLLRELGANLKKTMQADGKKLAKEMNALFELSMGEHLKKTSGDLEKINKFASELDRLEHQVIKAMQSGKGSKEMNDFMAQVGYNARQIAKIQEKLERNHGG